MARLLFEEEFTLFLPDVWDAAAEFFAVVGGAFAVALDDPEFLGGEPLDGGEAVGALETFAASADGFPGAGQDAKGGERGALKDALEALSAADAKAFLWYTNMGAQDMRGAGGNFHFLWRPYLFLKQFLA